MIRTWPTVRGRLEYRLNLRTGSVNWKTVDGMLVCDGSSSHSMTDFYGP
jgi:hypothetical protein